MNKRTDVATDQASDQMINQSMNRSANERRPQRNAADRQRTFVEIMWTERHSDRHFQASRQVEKY